MQGLAAAAAGQRLALVGGAVRDLLLHRVHNDPWRGLPDLDLVFEGRAIELVQRLAASLPPRSGCSWREHGSFGTVELELTLPDGEIWLLDVASARRESYPVPAENPRVSPGGLDDDLARRDFTVNAIALVLNADGCGVDLLDPHHGQQDLAHRRLRLLHGSSLLDDPTRLVRAARYAARLGFSLEQGSIAQARDVIRRWPWPWRAGDPAQAAPPALGTRLRMELELLLQREPWWSALTHLQAWGGLALLDAGLQRSRHWPVALRRAHRLGLEPLPVLLACGDHPAAVAARLQLPHRQQRWLQAFSQFREQLSMLEPAHTQAWDPAAWSLWLERQPDAGHVVPLALVCGARPRRPLLAWWFRWRHLNAGITAADLLRDGWTPGPAIGARLRQLRMERLAQLPWVPR
jgi:poly(A) polymerase